MNSKLGNLWFTYELERRLGAAGLAGAQRAGTVNAYDPGLVPGSGLAREYPASLRFVWDRAARWLDWCGIRPWPPDVGEVLSVAHAVGRGAVLGRLA